MIFHLIIPKRLTCTGVTTAASVFFPWSRTTDAPLFLLPCLPWRSAPVTVSAGSVTGRRSSMAVPPAKVTVPTSRNCLALRSTMLLFRPRNGSGMQWFIRSFRTGSIVPIRKHFCKGQRNTDPPDAASQFIRIGMKSLCICLMQALSFISQTIILAKRGTDLSEWSVPRRVGCSFNLQYP